MTEIFGKDKRRRVFFGLFVLSTATCAVATSLHYHRTYPGNPLTWLAWLASLFFLVATYFPSGPETREWVADFWEDKRFIRVFGVLALVFVVSHVWNFKTAPWNQNGLFDDAAWDIYFAKKYVFTHEPFQAAVSEGIAREVGFHYYITPFFILFGYNLLVFNVALLILGMVTFLFTALIVQKLFGNYFVTIVSALVFNFLPLHFLETFVGHRYAMAAPLITGSLYFVMTGFSRGSVFRIILGAILAAFCVESAIMGKHFLICLAGAAVLLVLTDYRRSLTKRNIGLTVIFVLGLIAAMMPLIIFVYYNPAVYLSRDRELTELFVQSCKNRATGALTPYINDLKGIFFAPWSYRRLALMDFVIIPFWYYVFIIPGLVIALISKRFEIVLLATVPVAGAFISTAYDFRVLHAAPFWIILMAFSFHALTRLETLTRSYLVNLGVFAVAGLVLALGFIPSLRYLYAKSKDPYSVHILAQSDVVVARFVRGIVAGVPHPSVRRTHDEFLRVRDLPEPTYDAFVCNDTGFAVMHLFLQDYGDKQIMSFCDQLPMLPFTDAGVFTENKKALSRYDGAKGVMLIWQQTPKSAGAINAFRKLSYLGSDRQLTTKHAGRSYSFYVLTIPKENVSQLKQQLGSLRLL
jgi:hypothetical protein